MRQLTPEEARRRYRALTAVIEKAQRMSERLMPLPFDVNGNQCDPVTEMRRNLVTACGEAVNMASTDEHLADLINQYRPKR